jgi:hypothetical protein
VAGNRTGGTETRRSARGGRTLLQYWLIFTGLTVFGFVLLWHFGLIRRMVLADRTYISSAIVLLYFVTTLHCFWRSAVVSREVDATQEAARLLAESDGRITVNGPDVDVEGRGVLPRSLVAGHVRDLVLKADAQSTRQAPRPLDQSLLLRGLAARLRGSNPLGGFVSDTMMKLGLVGTIIGFIVMLAPIAGLDPADRGAIKSSMSLMSDGMAIAMYTTLAGLVGSILVKIQYYMLESATGALFVNAVRMLELHVVPVLERPWNRPG